MDGTSWCRAIHVKKARTSSTGLSQPAKCEEEKFERATAMSGSD
jgi:hypothetical protein